MVYYQKISLVLKNTSTQDTALTNKINMSLNSSKYVMSSTYLSLEYRESEPTLGNTVNNIGNRIS